MDSTGLFFIVLGIVIVILFVFVKHKSKSPLQPAVDLINQNQVDEALVALETLVEQGNFEAAVMIAELCQLSEIVAKEDERLTPAYWYSRAADLNEDFRQGYILLLQDGRLPNGQSWEGADEKLLALLSLDAQRGDVSAQLNLAHFYSLRPSIPDHEQKQLEWLTIAAESKEPKAISDLADYYYSQYDWDKDDRTSDIAVKARLAFEQAMLGGDKPAKERYANMVLLGIGGVQDTQKAEQLLIEVAREEDDQFTYLELADHYLQGEHLTKDIDKARYWFTKAVEGEGVTDYIDIRVAEFTLDHPESDEELLSSKEKLESYARRWEPQAFSALGLMHELGKGVEINLLKAGMNYQLAAMVKNPDYIEQHQRVLSQLRGDERKQVDEMVSRFKSSHPITKEQQSEIDYQFGNNVLNSETATDKEKDIAYKVLRRSALQGHYVAIHEMPTQAKKIGQTLESLVWDHIVAKTVNATFGHGKADEFRVEQELEKLSEKDRQWFNEQVEELLPKVEAVA